MKRRCGTYIKSLLALPALLLLASCAADVSFSESVVQSLESDLTSRYIFYAFSPDDESDLSDGEIESVERAYDIGSTLDMTSLSFDDFSDLRTGYTLSGWTYYQNPVTGSSEVPDTCTVGDDSLVQTITVTPSPASFVAQWTLAYDDYGEFTVTILSDDIGITSTQSAGSITLTASAGFESYTWLVDGTDAASVSGATASGNTLTLTSTSLTSGYVYQITVSAVHANGITYSAQLQVEVDS